MTLYPEGHPTWNTKEEGRREPVALSEFVETVHAHGIDKSVFTGRQVIDDGSIVHGFPNDYVAECMHEFEDTIVGIGSVDHTQGLAAVDEIERAIDSLGLKGISLDPFFGYLAGVHDELIPVDDKTMYPIYEQCDSLNVPVLITLGPNAGRLHDPDAVSEVAFNFPDLPIVLAHGCWPKPTEMVALVYRRGFDNVYLEASSYQWHPGAEPFVEAADSIIQNKVVYGSSFPLRPLDSIDRFRDLPLSEESLHEILSVTPSNILDL